MVRYANRSRMAIRVPDGSTPRPWVHGARTHHFPGSLHAPYDVLPLLAVGKAMINAQRILVPCRELGRRRWANVKREARAGRAIGAVPRQTRFVRRLLLVRAAPVSDN